MINVIVTRTGFNQLKVDAGLSKATLDFDSVAQMREFIRAIKPKLSKSGHEVTVTVKGA